MYMLENESFTIKVFFKRDSIYHSWIVILFSAFTDDV